MHKLLTLTRKLTRLLLVAMAISLNLAGQAHAKPVVKLKIQDAVFLQDDSTSKWTIKWRGFNMEPPYTFDDITLHKTLGDTSSKGFIALISGSQGNMCEQNFRVLFFTPDTNIREFAGFKTCYATKISMKIEGNVLVVQLDKEREVIDLASMQNTKQPAKTQPAPKPQSAQAKPQARPKIDNKCYDDFYRQASALGIVDANDEAKIRNMCAVK